MDKSLLKQALKFKDANPTYSQIEKLDKIAKLYQSKNGVVFLEAKYRQKSKILDENLFFEFLSDAVVEADNKISSFEDIEKILKSTTRKENIQTTGDSKNSIVRVFNSVVVFQYSDSNPILYKDTSQITLTTPIVAVENAETFLNIYQIMSKFGYENFVYLGGFSNTLTREFLRDKEVVFFLDYDIEAIKIYDSFECKKKSFFKHQKVEEYFKDKKISNQKLYLKQIASNQLFLQKKHPQLQWLIELIKDNSTVVEQEIFS